MKIILFIGNQEAEGVVYPSSGQTEVGWFYHSQTEQTKVLAEQLKSRCW